MLFFLLFKQFERLKMHFQ